MNENGRIETMAGVTVQLYVGQDGKNHIRRWLDALTPAERVRVLRFLNRLEDGNFSDTKSVGSGVMELRLHFGPGYRVYYGRWGDMLAILLCGGTKQHQARDILKAQALWREYGEERKREHADCQPDRHDERLPER